MAQGLFVHTKHIVEQSKEAIFGGSQIFGILQDMLQSECNFWPELESLNGEFEMEVVQLKDYIEKLQDRSRRGESHIAGGMDIKKVIADCKKFLKQADTHDGFVHATIY